MKKLEDKKIMTEETVESERREDIVAIEEEEKKEKERPRDLIKESVTVTKHEQAGKKSEEKSQKREKRQGSRAEEVVKVKAGARRGVSLGGEREVGLRSEKYVSVNMIKRVLEGNLIYIEDLVDEIFRHLGDNIVNKNYFAQVIGNYLNCLPLPEQYGLQIQDIVNKMFDICDRNGDGLISYNDLGSGAALFSQNRPTMSKERRLYKLLDPQNRGFIIETDIVSVLTKANTLANSSGKKLYSGHEEIAQVAKNLMKELDKEKKGVISYWDIFLWKDTQGFSELLNKLEGYTNSLDELSSAKKSISSPNRQGFMSNNRSPVQGTAPLYSSYSPGMNTNQENTSLKFTTFTAEASKSLGPSLYAGTARTDNAGPTTPAPAINNQASSYLYTQQSPNGQGLLQNLSAFDSLSKEIKIEDMLQSVNSGGFGNKIYVTDLSISPQSKPYTPIKDPLAPGTEAKSYTMKESPSDQMKMINLGLTPAPEETKVSNQAQKGTVDLMNQDIYNRGTSNQPVNSKAASVGGFESYMFTVGAGAKQTNPKINETAYLYSSDIKGYAQSPGTDFKSYMDLPYKSVEVNTKTSDAAPNWRDYLANLKEKEETATVNQGGTTGFKPYSPTLNLMGNTGNVGTQENKGINYEGSQQGAPNILIRDLTESKSQSQDYGNFTLGNNMQPNYGMDSRGVGLKVDEKISVQDYGDKLNQSYGQKSGLHESLYSGDAKSYLHYPEGQSYGLASNTKENNLKESVVAYNAEGQQALKASVSEYGETPDKKNYLSYSYKAGDFESKLYEYGSYPYSASLKQSGYQEGGLSSPVPAHYKSDTDARGSGYGLDWYTNSESKDPYGHYSSAGNERGGEGAGKIWNEQSYQGSNGGYGDNGADKYSS